MRVVSWRDLFDTNHSVLAFLHVFYHSLREKCLAYNDEKGG